MELNGPHKIFDRTLGENPNAKSDFFLIRAASEFFRNKMMGSTLLLRGHTDHVRLG